MRWLLPVLLGVVWSVSACGQSEPESVQSGEPPPVQQGRLLEFDARVVRVELEGGFWGLVAADGTRYDPADLPEAFRQEGLTVHVSARPLEGAVSFHMWGKLVRIESIERR